MHHNYFELGDTVTVRHLDKSPEMVVKLKLFLGDKYDLVTGKVDTKERKPERKLIRVVTFWFNDQGDYCEQDFDYKDLSATARARETAIV